jgi:hypothetical protein
MADGERQWATGVLRRLGKQPTERNVSNLVGWAKAEGGHTNNDARYNYLNTTQPMPGAGNTGSQGNIKVYRNLEQGIEATAKTLRNGRYGGIIRALDGSPQQLASAISSSPWGTHNPNLASIIASGQGTRPAGSYGSGSSASPQVDTTQSSAIDSGAASVDAAGAQQAKLSYLENSHDPNALLTLAATLKQTGSAAGGIGGTQQGYSSPAAGDPGLQSEDQLRQHTTAGAAAALSWANSKVGDPSSRESGVNAGGLAGALNKRFGMSNQPWCAMFTSLAVVKGGAPKAAQTASVAQVRAKAQAGGQGYVKGFIRPGQARAGDLVLFGNSHIAMVQKVVNGKIKYVGGNQSDNVTLGETPAGAGVTIVRPQYRR